jgi:hypothetical protein
VAEPGLSAGFGRFESGFAYNGIRRTTANTITDPKHKIADPNKKAILKNIDPYLLPRATTPPDI